MAIARACCNPFWVQPGGTGTCRTTKRIAVTTDMNTSRYTIRRARACDIPAVREMQARSMWTLGARFYTRAEIANFMAAFGTMDNAIILEGHFFLAEDPNGAIVASGGW